MKPDTAFIPRRIHLLLCLVLAAVAVRPALAAPPNVLFIVSDDQQHDTMSCAGHPAVWTPNIDRIARDGVRFSHAFAPTPICTPSRASYMTGTFGTTNGVMFFGQKIHDNIVTWPQVMNRRGYQTAFTGKWHNVRDAAHYGFKWTANIFNAGMAAHSDAKFSQKPGEKAEIIPGDMTERITDAALRFFDQRDTSRPFFLYVSYAVPHDPRDPTGRFATMYDPARIPLPGNFLPTPKFDPGTMGIRDEKLLPVPRPEDQLRREIAAYYGLISQMDEQIGRILDGLRTSGLEENTIVIFAGDQGLALGAHGFLGKQTLYDEGVREPLLIRHPQLKPAGEVRDALVYLLDLMPTVCEWTGAELPDGVEGRSLAKVYTGQEKQVRDAVFGHYNERDEPLFRMVRTDTHKLIRYNKLQRVELFDLRSDPLEMKDLSDDPALGEVRRDLETRLDAWLRERGDMAAPAAGG